MDAIERQRRARQERFLAAPRDLTRDIQQMLQYAQPLQARELPGGLAGPAPGEADSTSRSGASLSFSVDQMDSDWNHLYPQFRQLLQTVLAETAARTGEPWVLVEGYRSQARQTWLYAQGRTRPGQIVTWKRTPTWHGTGLAADCAPARTKTRGYGQIPHSHWETYRRIYQSHGLDNPAWGKGDLQHVQLSDAGVHQLAVQWIARGFR